MTIEKLTDEERAFIEAQVTSDPADEFAKALRIIDAQAAEIEQLRTEVAGFDTSGDAAAIAELEAKVTDFVVENERLLRVRGIDQERIAVALADNERLREEAEVHRAHSINQERLQAVSELHTAAEARLWRQS
ncbi:MAG: hypothetical protein V4593_08080 [Pseudomonadota bacterium]